MSTRRTPSARRARAAAMRSGLLSGLVCTVITLAWLVPQLAASAAIPALMRTASAGLSVALAMALVLISLGDLAGPTLAERATGVGGLLLAPLPLFAIVVLAGGARPAALCGVLAMLAAAGLTLAAVASALCGLLRDEGRREMVTGVVQLLALVAIVIHRTRLLACLGS
jgi:hypothetical protein